MRDVILLPGIITPAELRYPRLVEHLDGANVILKELEVYAAEEPSADYSIAAEIAGIDAAAARAGFERFHLYGHSGGASCALAYAAARPARVISLAVDEPPTDFTDQDHADPYWGKVAAAEALEGTESIAAFLALQLAPGVPLPAELDGPAPSWMANRPAGVGAFATAMRAHDIDPSRYRSFRSPVLFTHGSLSHPRWLDLRDRLAAMFPDFKSELFEGLHHLNSPDRVEPARIAALLCSLWSRAETG